MKTRMVSEMIGSLVYWHINLCGLFNAKAILEEQQSYNWIHSCKDNGVHIFPKGISLKVNVIVWLTHYDVTVQYVSQLYGSVSWGLRIYWLHHCRTYIKYIWFGLTGFYGISTIGGYLMPNPLYTYILNMLYIDLWPSQAVKIGNAPV